MLGTVNLNINKLRDMLQTIILSEIFNRTKTRNDLVLKGGMAIRTTIHSERYTKDIDLDGNPQVPLYVLQARIRIALSIMDPRIWTV